MSNNNETGGAAGQKPGNGFVRPCIDDRPDLDKALTPEQKEAVSRLAVPLPKKAKSEDSAASVGVQETRMVAESGSPVAAMASSVDAAVLDPNSAFNDMRDPMVSADGHRPSKTEIVRLGVGFTLSAVACAIPWVALSAVILPQVLENIDPATKESMLGTINAVGSIVALLANVIFGTLSDMTRSRFGKRSPWIVLGGLIAGLSVGLIALAQHSFPAILVLWCCAQLGYNVMLAPFVATMSDRVPDKVRGTISGFYGAGIAAGQTLGNVVGAKLNDNGATGVTLGWLIGAAVFALIGIITVAIWPREGSNVNEKREEITAKSVLMNFRPPRHAPDFYFALVGRTLMMGGYWMINSYLFYISQDYIYAGQPHAKDSANALIAVMGVITLVVSLIAALTAGPITDKIGRRKLPVALASCLFAVGILMPLLMPSRTGMLLFAAVAGLGYGVYNAIDQALNVSVLPNPDEAGKDLGILNLANTLSTVIGSVFTSTIISISKGMHHVTATPPSAYRVVFIVAIAIVLIAAYLIMRIKKVK